jgi:gliding motility-associated-like protein
MLGTPHISQQIMAGSSSLALQGGIWSYGLVEFSPANAVPTGGAWRKVTTLGFKVNNFDAQGNSNCIALSWNTALPAITTIQQWVNFSCQPNMVFTSYGNNSTCIIDSCNTTSGALNLTALPTNITCTGTNDGTVNLTVTGGTAPYSYLWSNGATTEDISSLAAGTYSVTVTDAASQTATLGSLVVGSSSLTVQYTVEDASCNQTDDGSITINNVLGGTPPFTYAWSNGATTSSISLLVAGIYNVTVTDANGCTGIVNRIALSEPAAFQYNVFIDNISCAGGTDGALDFTLTGGTAPYTYLWVRYDLNTYMPIDTLGTSQDLTGLTSGLYGVEVQDANGCDGAVFFLLVEPDPIQISGLPSDVTAVSCAGGNDGAINISANGGTGVISFLWSNGAQTEDLEDLTAGSYSVTATDLNACTATRSFTVTQPDTIKITIDPLLTANVSCYGGNDGAISITVTGGNGGLTFSWSNGATTQNLTGLAAGTYSITVSDSLGCQGALANITVTQPDSLTLTASSTTVSCNATSDGTATIAVAGGTAPYTYLWSNGSTTANLTNLVTGNYTVTVTDAKGCIKSASVTVGVANCPPIARNDINNTLKNVPVSGDISTNDRDPDGDDLTFTVISGPSNGTLTAFDPATGTYTYTPNNGFVGEDTYTYYTCDNGIPSLCDTATVYIEVLDDPKDPFNNPPIANADHFITYVNTQIGSTVINNDYDPDTADIILVNATLIQLPSHGIFFVLPNGDFTYTPDNGFVGNDTLQYSICDNGTPGPKCDTAFVVITVLSGPGGPGNLPPVAVDDAFYTELNNPVNGTVIPNDYDTDGNQISVTVPQFSGPSNGSLTILPNGDFVYTPNTGYVGPDQFVYILCDNGVPSLCDTATAYILIQNPANQPPIARNDINNTLLNTPVSGSVATNDEEPDGDNVIFTQLTSTTNGAITGFNPVTGTYTYTPNAGFIGTDVFTYSICDDGIPSLCDTALVTIHVIPPFNFDNNPPVANPDDYVTYINTPVTGTVIPNDFDPDTADIITVGITLITPPTNGTVTSISPNGVFTYVPTTGFIGDDTFEYILCDNGNPSLCDTALVTVHVLPPNGGGNLPPVAVDDAYITQEGVTITNTVIPNDYDQDGNNIVVTVPQFTGPSHGSLTILPNGDFVYVPNAGYTGPDQFTYILCDNGVPSLCDTATAYITIYNVMQIVLTPDSVDCFGASTGSIALTVINGNAPFTYLWSTGATTQNLTGVPAGIYSVTVTDAYGVTVAGTDTVFQPGGAISATEVIVIPTCNGLSDASINLTVSGGSPGYTFQWSNGATTEDISGLAAGTYSVTITDGNSCTYTNSYLVTQPNVLVATIDGQTNVACNGGNTGAIDLGVTGGTIAYSYAWSNGATSEDISGLAIGTYTVTVTDANGCTAAASATITQNDALTVTATGTTNVSCNGLSDGVLDISVSGGVPAYTYVWSNGATTEDITGLAAGSYKVTVTDAAGCTGTGTFNISEPAVLTASATADNVVTCFGGNDGSITLTVNGGTTAYSFVWSNGATTQNIGGLTVGTYTVTVTDANNCTATASATVTENPQLDVTLAGVTSVSCNGGNDGAIDVNVSGGVSPYTYAWSNGATTQDLSGLTAGTYVLTATDAVGCTYVDSATVTEPTLLVASINGQTDVACNGGNTGAIDLGVTGGTATYTYAWSNGATTEDISGLAVGTYTVTVTDANGCSATASATITESPSLVIDLDQIIDVSCNGLTNGTIFLNISGGTPSYIFSWTGPGTYVATTQNISGLGAGTYNVTVTDAAGCTANGTFTVNEPATLTASAAPDNVVSCYGGNDGSITLTVSGGTTAYAFIWSNGATTQNISGLTAGTYDVTVTDANNCTATASATVTEQPQLVVSLNGSNDVSCNGGNDGDIDIAVSGGVSPYTYTWSNGATTEDLTGLSAGTYDVTVTDANNCTATGSFTIGEPTLLVATIDGQNNVACNGGNTGAIDLGVTGGTAAYSFAWSNGATTEDISGLTIGTYTVTVTDANGCTAIASATITENDPLQVSATGTTNVSCYGNADGALDIAVTGGVSPYTFVWSNGATTEDVTGLAAGTYDVTVTDAAGCTGTGSFTIAEPNELTIEATADNVSCDGGANGAADLLVGGGTLPYSFSWSNGSTIEDLTGLTAGVYSVTVTDANGCTIAATVTVGTDNILVLNTAVTNATCGQSNGVASVSVSGGSGSFTYAWSTTGNAASVSGLAAGTYSVTVIDAVNGCTATRTLAVSGTSSLAVVPSVTNASCGGTNGSISLAVSGGTPAYTYAWSNGASTSTAANLAAGTYSVTVNDANGCPQVLVVEVENDNNSLGLLPSANNATCGQANGDATVSPLSGTAPFTYAWSNGSTATTATNLAAGTYFVTVTDANGCSEVATININNTNGPSVSVDNVVNVTCANGSTGSIAVVVSGGTAPYTYFWSNGSISRSVSNLPAGTYTVTVTDANGCQSSLAATVGTPDAIDVIVDATQVSCNNANNGSVTVRVSGGVGPYSFNWSNGATSQNLVSLAPGAYTVTVTDANSCNASTPATISEPDQLEIAYVTTDVNCTDGTDGAIDITVTGGTAPYTYAWSNGATTEDLTGLAEGIYSVTISDANGCTATANIGVNTLNNLVLNTAATNATCGQSNGVATVSVSGGSGSFTYNWATGNTASLGNLAPGIYSVTVTDAVNGCTATANVAVSGSSDIDVTAATVGELCGTSATGSISLGVTGGTAPYTYAWSTPLGSGSSASGLTAGTYFATVTDAAGCLEVLILEVEEIISLRALVNTTDANCGQANGSATVAVNGGTAPYTYAWSNGATAANASNLAAGIYFVTITDANGCSTQTSAPVANISGPAITIDNVTNLTCANSSTGAVDVSVTGGVGPYTYLWSNGDTTQDLTNLPSGPFSLTVTDAAGCQASTLVRLSTPTAIVVITEGTDVSCNNANNGSTHTVVSGGVGPYTYAWSNGATTADLSALAAGTYTLTVTDANGCSVSTPVVITQPDVLTVTANPTGVTCNGNADGTVTSSVVGGTAPYTYQWSNGATTADLTALGAGLYSVTVTDANGCTATVSATVNVTNALVINLGITNATCGDSNGAIDASVSGGSAPYTYTWSNGGSGNSLSGLAAGSYGLTVTDANGCSATTTAAVSSTSTIAVTPTVTPVVCGGGNTGAISLATTGGSGTLSFAWSNGATSASIAGLAAGTYTVTVTDTSDCQTVVSIEVEETSPFTITSSATAADCGGSNGDATVTVSGGTAPYTYAWSNGATSATATALVGGLYEVTITDANGCSATEYVVVPNTTAIDVTVASVDNVSCGQANGAININVTGGATPYTYLWSNGATTANLSGLNAGTYAVTVTDANGCSGATYAEVEAAEAVVFVADRDDINCFNAQDGSITVSIVSGNGPFTYQWSPAGQGASLTNLGAGAYAVTVTAANGCSATASVTLTQPDELVATLDSATNVTCNGLANGSIDVTATGGTQPYSFDWGNAGNTEDLSGLGAGTYTLVVTDANGCSSQPLQVTITEPDTLVLSLIAADTLSCYGNSNGTATVAATGGTAPYTYDWSNSDTAATATGLSAGTYTVSVSDANGCTSNTITVTITQPDSMMVMIAVSELNCYNDSTGEVRVKGVLGGTAPYTYSWSTGAGNVSDLTGVPAGTYTVTITDANGCTTSESATLVNPAQLIVASNITNVTCQDSTDGSISLTISGGTGAATVNWAHGPQTDLIDNLEPGDYTVTVTDGKGCSYTETFSITAGNCNNPPIAVNDTVTTVSGTPIDIPVLGNDSDPDGDNINVTGISTPPNHGTTTINGDGTITYTPDTDFVGVDSFMYVICDDGIPSLCDSAWVFVTVLPDRPNVSIPNGFSPDGDGINDNFEIVDITKFPKNKLEIFNRWGNTVYKAQPYNNDWNGTNMDEEPLPDGTYFYVLEINDGTTPPYTGFVVIHRGSNK